MTFVIIFLQLRESIRDPRPACGMPPLPFLTPETLQKTMQWTCPVWTDPKSARVFFLVCFSTRLLKDSKSHVSGQWKAGNEKLITVKKAKT